MISEVLRQCEMVEMNGGTRLPLTNGGYAIVDDSDFPNLIAKRWYWVRNVDGSYQVKSYLNRRTPTLLHRFILQPPSNRVVDHANHNRFDNRRANIRIATLEQNQQNCRKVSKHGFKGVYKTIAKCGTWGARIKHNKIDIYLGTFPTVEQAARAYDEKAIELFREFACLNFDRLERGPQEGK